MEKLASISITTSEVPFPVPSNASAVFIPDNRFAPMYFAGDWVIVSTKPELKRCVGSRLLVILNGTIKSKNTAIAVSVLRYQEGRASVDLQDARGNVHFDVKPKWSALVLGIVSATAAKPSAAPRSRAARAK